MKIATIIIRSLLGLAFVVFGANAFLNFMPMPDMPDSAAKRFILAMMESHYTMAVGAFEIVGGLLLLLGRYVPLGLTLLGPVIINIALFHLFLEPQGLPLAAVVNILAAFLLYRYRDAFAGLLRP